MNKIQLLGRICNDLDIKKTQSGKSVISFNLAVDRKIKEKITDFIPCVAWEQRAETIKRYFNKGDKICVSGELQSRNYDDKDGNKRTAYNVVINEFDFCESKKNDVEFVEVEADEELPF